MLLLVLCGMAAILKSLGCLSPNNVRHTGLRIRFSKGSPHSFQVLLFWIRPIYLLAPKTYAEWRRAAEPFIATQATLRSPGRCCCAPSLSRSLKALAERREPARMQLVTCSPRSSTS